MSKKITTLPIPENYNLVSYLEKDLLIDNIKIDNENVELKKYVGTYTFYVSVQDQTYRLCRYENHTCEGSDYGTNNNLKWCFDMVLSPDELYLYASIESDILKFRTSNGEYLGSLNKNAPADDGGKKYDYYSKKIAITPDGKKLYSSKAADKHLICYDLTADINILNPRILKNIGGPDYGIRSLLICGDYIIMANDTGFYSYNVNSDTFTRFYYEGYNFLVLGYNKEKNEVYLHKDSESVTTFNLNDLVNPIIKKSFSGQNRGLSLSSAMVPEKGIIYIGTSGALLKISNLQDKTPLSEIILNKTKTKTKTNTDTCCISSLHIKGDYLYVLKDYRQLYWYKIGQEKIYSGILIDFTKGVTLITSMVVQSYRSYIDLDIDGDNTS